MTRGRLQPFRCKDPLARILGGFREFLVLDIKELAEYYVPSGVQVLRWWWPMQHLRMQAFRFRAWPSWGEGKFWEGNVQGHESTVSTGKAPVLFPMTGCGAAQWAQSPTVLTASVLPVRTRGQCRPLRGTWWFLCWCGRMVTRPWY